MGKNARWPATVTVVVLAVVAALGGTALAGSGATAAKKHADASADTKLFNSLLKSAAPKLRVKQALSADSAKHATSADSAKHARSADVAGQTYRAYVLADTSPNHATVTVPAGDYTAVGSCQAIAGPDAIHFGSAFVSLSSNNDSAHDVSAFMTVPNSGFTATGSGSHYGDAIASQTTAYHLPNGGTITMRCEDAGGTDQTLSYGHVSVTATRIARAIFQ